MFSLARSLVPLVLLAACTQTGGAGETAGNTVNGARADAAPALLPLTIRSAAGQHRFDVEVAATPQQQQQGLMFRKTLAPDRGMLFPMETPRIASFWMKNTLIPLDILFVRTDGTIAFIAADTVPYSREPVSAGVPVGAVLEIAGGRAAALGIQEGDHVQWGGCAIGAPPVAQPAIAEFCPSR
ncbi:MAG: DUF192 domain-containing protein [Sphingobium sp.]